ncbi:MAG: outer membrane beta-barrel protein [Bacteroidaceae bacterium]|nr:outer membrane beta-barrel protein [Bacteroidaceae bacterium]
MKKFVIALLATVLSTQAFAQFEKGTSYVAAGLSGLNISYNSGTKFHFNIDAIAGHFFFDDWMFLGVLGFDHSKDTNIFKLGVGARYYITQNGIHLGANVLYGYDSRSDTKHNNFFIGPEVGYTFFLNQHVTIEPAIYYNISLNNFSGSSEVGLRIGIGYFFNNGKRAPKPAAPVAANN